MRMRHVRWWLPPRQAVSGRLRSPFPHRMFPSSVGNRLTFSVLADAARDGHAPHVIQYGPRAAPVSFPRRAASFIVTIVLITTFNLCNRLSVAIFCPLDCSGGGGLSLART